MCPSEDDGLAQAGIIGSHRLSGGGDLAEVIGAFDLGCVGVQRVGELLETARGLLDFLADSHLDNIACLMDGGGPTP